MKNIIGKISETHFKNAYNYYIIHKYNLRKTKYFQSSILMPKSFEVVWNVCQTSSMQNDVIDTWWTFHVFMFLTTLLLE